MNTPFNISLSLNVSLPLNNAFLAYCAGIDPAEEWELGGVSGYGDRSDELNISRIDDFVSAMSRGEPTAKSHVVQFAVQMFTEFWSGEPVIKKHFDGYRFFFITGIPRSGGTYLLTQLYALAGIDHRTLSRAMLRDSIPGSKKLNRGEIHSPGENNALFELFQFLAWAKEAVDSKFVVQKNVNYVHWMQTLNRVFGDQADYAITIRHPLAYMASVLQLNQDTESWEELFALSDGAPRFESETTRLQLIAKSAFVNVDFSSVLDVLLANWEIYYLDVVQHRPAGEIVTFAYGDPMVGYFQENHPGYLETSPGGLNWTPDQRDYDAFVEKFGIDMAKVDAAIDRVRGIWRARGYQFPELPQTMV